MGIAVLALVFLGAVACGDKKVDADGTEKVAKTKKAAAEKPKAAEEEAAEGESGSETPPTVEESGSETPPTVEEAPAAEEPKPKKSAPGKIILDDYTGGKSPVAFDHKAHTKAAGCKTCHHEDQSACSECHEKTAGDAPSLKSAYHDNCKGCHKRLVKENPESLAPTKCAGCHK